MYAIVMNVVTPPITSPAPKIGRIS